MTILVVLVVLAAAGCGGKKKTAASATTSATTTTTTTTTATATTTTAASSGSTPSFASAKNCVQLASLAAKVAQSVGTTTNGKADLSKEADAIEALANAAPGEIKGDFKTFADAFAGYVKAYRDSGLKPGQVPTAAQLAKFEAAAKQLSTPKVQAAMGRLSAWATKHCGGLTGTNG